MFSTIAQRSQSILHMQKYFAAKELLFGSQARKKLLEGCRQLSNAVQVTLGPGGRNVLIDQSYGSPKITKDGVTVAKAVDLPDRPVNIGASLVKDVANKANDEAGDGTTTATILARAIYEEGFKKVEAGLNPTHLKKGIDKAVDFVSEELRKRSTEVRGRDAISNVATISANGDRAIGNMLADLYEKVGVHGTITIQEGKTLHHEIEFVDGLKFDRGYISPYFVTDEKKQKIEFENCYVLIVEKKLGNIRDILPFLELTYQEQKPLLIIAEDLESELLAGLILNRLKNNLKICAVKAPSFGDNRKAILQDIAIFTGGRFISEEAGVTLESTTTSPEEIKATLGVAKNITITKDDTIILNGNGAK
jgi:chaperonin GroEL